jgi:cytochrome c peroxidase
MPEHGHGMNRVPLITKIGDGEFLVQGMLFHMSGRWDLIVNVRAERAFAQAVFETEITEPPATAAGRAAVEFSDAELRRILRASPLPPAKPDTTNAFATDPAAAHFGQFLFYDLSLSADGSVGCVTCHLPDLAFADGRQLSRGIDDLERHSPGLWNLGHNRFFFWDGRADSLWSQALQPLEDPREHGIDRQIVLETIRDDPLLARAYREVFGPLPPPDDAQGTDVAFANVGKSIAAFVARLTSDRAPFDVFVEGLVEDDADKLAALSPAAQRGLKRFMGDANCHLCHSGPNFTDQEFHSTRVPPLTPELGDDPGRQEGVRLLLEDPFNGLGAFSDDTGPAAHLKLDYTKPRVDNYGQFKTPSLRNVAVTPPYMHQGQFATLRDVLHHYSTFENAFDPIRNHFELTLVPLELEETEMDELEAFLQSLTDTDIDPALLSQPASPSLDGA